MPTGKNYGSTKSRKGQAGKASAKKTTAKKSAARESGPLPPYGNPIREAIARGDLAEMRRVAASSRRWIRDAQAALERLEKSIARLEE